MKTSNVSRTEAFTKNQNEVNRLQAYLAETKWVFVFSRMV